MQSKLSKHGHGPKARNRHILPSAVRPGDQIWQGCKHAIAPPAATDVLIEAAAPCRRRARHTIEDFVKSYFPLHSLQTEDFLRWWDVLVYAEAVIYQLDEDNERLALAGGAVTGEEHAAGYAALTGVLQQRGLLSEGVRLELEAGMRYWREERRLCACMLRAPAVPPASGHDPGFSLDDVHAASENKSFDYRVLHRLLCELRGVAPDPSLLEFLAVDEHLVDIGDDLVDYEHDVMRYAVWQAARTGYKSPRLTSRGRRPPGWAQSLLLQELVQHLPLLRPPARARGAAAPGGAHLEVGGPARGAAAAPAARGAGGPHAAAAGGGGERRGAAVGHAQPHLGRGAVPGRPRRQRQQRQL